MISEMDRETYDKIEEHAKAFKEAANQTLLETKEKYGKDAKIVNDTLKVIRQTEKKEKEALATELGVPHQDLSRIWENYVPF